MFRLPAQFHDALPRGLITLLLMGAASLAHATLPPTSFKTDQVEVRLVPSVSEVHPGQRITIGFQQRIIPHWHTYWRNPGDSGLPTTLTWTLPKGAKADAIQWPIPKHFDLGPVTNFGYETEVTLLSDITLPADLKPGQTLPIQVDATWLVCQEICIPQKAQLGLTLPVVAQTSAMAPTEPTAISNARSQLPQPPSWSPQVTLSGQDLSLGLPKEATQGGSFSDIRFFPSEWGPVSHQAPQPRQTKGAHTTLRLSAGEAPIKAGQHLSGVLVVTQGSGPNARRQGHVIEASVLAQGAADPPEASLNLGSALILALLGGLILNLMPCVFPVLSIKALSLLNHREYTTRQTRLHGVAYTLGVLTSFLVLAGVLLSLKAAGDQAGWGFQFQSPSFVLAVAYLMLAVGLSLSGVFTIGTSVTNVGSGLTQHKGYAGSFFTGVLATVVATPCTAPFMGGAIGFALVQPALVLLAVFLSLGLGLALPYLVLSWWPALQRWLPRPGAWMERFKQLLAFPMYAAAAWLVWVLGQQAGIHSVGLALLGMVSLAFAAWVFESARTASGAWRRFSLIVAPATLAGVLAASHVTLSTLGSSVASGSAPASPGQQAWEPYTKDRLEALRAQGKPVFVNLTAAWCITCLVNERVALNQDSVKQAFLKSGVHYLKGDWTNQDPQISEILARFNRSGVPLYVFYPAGASSQPVVLPQLLTPDAVIQVVTSPAPEATHAASP